MSFRVSFSHVAERSVDNSLTYLLFEVGETGNPQAAAAFLKDLDYVVERLSSMPGSYALCENDRLAERGIRKIHFKHLNYKALYHVFDDTVIIDYICHDMQDYDNFA